MGLHDLALAYMVIAHSQRDPGEYMLELQGFASAASPALQKHAIDMHLGRWLPALQHLLSAGDQHFEAALQLAQNKVCSTRHELGKRGVGTWANYKTDIRRLRSFL